MPVSRWRRGRAMSLMRVSCHTVETGGNLRYRGPWGRWRSPHCPKAGEPEHRLLRSGGDQCCLGAETSSDRTLTFGDQAASPSDGFHTSAAPFVLGATAMDGTLIALFLIATFLGG